jgi:2-iminobutanoate/2-iminopropanoate deaminase
MVLHPRRCDGERQKLALNELVEEALNLADHGVRAQVHPRFHSPIAIAAIVAASSAPMNICDGRRAMAMKIDRTQPAGMNVRMQQGKPAYSHVVTVTGPGKTIYIAGQLARDAEGNIVGPGDMRAQLEQTFKNLDACLKAAGATWVDVVKTNTFVTDYQAFSQCSDVRMRYFGIASPTSTTIRISGLAQPEAMVEIEMIAVVE